MVTPTGSFTDFCSQRGWEDGSTEKEAACATWNWALELPIESLEMHRRAKRSFEEFLWEGGDE